MSVFIGIDGGGTKTFTVLTDEDGNVLMTDLTGGTNPNDIGVEKSCEVIAGIIERLAKNIDEENIYVFCGIAGSINRKSEMLDTLRSRFPMYHIDLESDAYILLSSELYENNGACVICGTGSVCFVRKDGNLIRIGGWGYLLDSGGSGYDIGRDVLEYALRAYDGRGEDTILTSLIEEKCGKTAIDLISEIYDGGKAYIASFASLAFEGVAKDDGVSISIIEKNAYHIYEYLASAAKQLPEGFTAVFGGGICTHYSKIWFDSIRKYLNFDVNFRLATMPPVFGAVVEALKLAQIRADYQIRENFLKSMK